MSARDLMPTTPIASFVQRYAKSGTSRLHMPGHKGCGPLGCEALDITEIKGADELYEADGIIAESEANAARLFGTAATYYSTEGSSQCIRAMLFLALRAAPCSAGHPVLLAARNAHKALLYAAALLDFDIEWLWPQQQADANLCSCPIGAAQLKSTLQTHKKQGKAPFGVYVTSPDYLGGVQDIAALAAVCKEQGVPLLVDNAHGAYLHFLPGGSLHPIALGAAMCCDSGHKTLPVLTGGAYLHLGRDAPVQDSAAVRGALALFGSTSPSYLTLQSLDLCNLYLAGGYTQRLQSCVKALAELREELNQKAAAVGCRPMPLVLANARREPLKLTIEAAALGCTGRQLADMLRRKNIECEYADPRFVVLMFTPENPPDDFARLRRALDERLNALPPSIALPALPAGEVDEFAALQAQATQKCTIRQAMLARQEVVSTANARGRVCAMPTVSCPPAIPIAVSGEEISPAALALFTRYGVDKISVVKDIL